MSNATGIAAAPPGLAARARHPPLRAPWPWLLPLAALLLPSALLAGSAWLAWRDIWNDARVGLSRSADAAAAYAARALDGYSVAAGRIDDALRGLSDADIVAREAELHGVLAALVRELPRTEAAYVVDRNGYPLVGASVFPVPRDRPVAADRDFFLALSGPAPPSVHVSRVYESRFDGKPFFAISRRRVGTGNGVPASEFDGLVNISVSPEPLAAGLGRSREAPGDRIGLIRSDGHFLVRTEGMAALLPELPEGSFFRVAAAADVAAAQTDRAVDAAGRTLVAALRRVDGFPAYAAATRDRATVVARWRQRVASYLLFGIPTTIGLLGLSLQIRRAQGQLVAANAALAAALSTTSARLARAQEVGGVHPFEAGPDGTRECDDRMRALFGLAPGARFDLPTYLACVHPDDRERVRARQRTLAASGGAFETEYRVVRPDGSVVWLLSRGEAVAGGGELPARMLGIVVDVTALKDAEAALAESETRLRMAQEAGGIGSWEWDVASGRLRWTAQTFALFGFDPAAGEPPHALVHARRHPEDRMRLEIELAQAVATGRLDTEYRVLRPLPGGGTEVAWIATRGGRAPGRDNVLIGVHRDITERKRSEAHVALLAREVEHRSKNALAVVQATLRLTRAATHEEYLRVVTGRIAALARAHSLFADRGLVGAELGALIQGELAPFAQRDGQAGAQVALSGPALTLPVAITQPLAMVIHELATNAAKHGALSVPAGSLSVTWAQAGDALRITWTERGTPGSGAPPTHTGFGTRVIEQTMRGQLGGELVRRWEAGGLVVELRLPLAQATDAAVPFG